MPIPLWNLAPSPARPETVRRESGGVPCYLSANCGSELRAAVKGARVILNALLTTPNQQFPTVISLAGEQLVTFNYRLVDVGLRQ